LNEYGTIVVGYCDSSTSDRPFMWQKGAGFSEMSTRSNRTISRPVAVSTDGAIVIGYDRISVAAPSEATVWQSEIGISSISSMAIEMGATIDGWNLTNAAACIPDCSVIVGSGTNPEGESEAWIFRSDW
jgi:uncharacterized membrane protein